MPFDALPQIEVRPEVAVLDEIKKLLTDPARWHQGHFIQDGAMCLIGALNVARGRPANECEFHDIDNRICSAFGMTPFKMTEFNDDDATEHADILKAIDAARVRLLAQS